MTPRILFTGSLALLMILLIPTLLSAQRGDIIIATGASIAVPLNAQICADRVFANNPGYGTLTLADPSCLCAGAIIVPVEFLTLSAQYHGGSVTVLWRTASETNCAGYEVQRSKDRSDWNAIGSVPGHGTTLEEYAYGYEDVLPPGLYQERTLYYRLRQIDYDGSYGYSPVVEVAIDGSAGTLSFQTTYPNPASDRITFQYSLPDAVHARVAVYAISGREIATFDGSEFSGGGEHVLSVKTASLPPGVYLVELSANDTRLVRQFVVRR